MLWFIKTKDSFFIKIDPCRIEFAMIIPSPHCFGKVRAWEHNLRLPLQSQNWEFGASSSEKCPSSTKKSASKMTKLPSPLTVASLRNERGQRPPTNGAHPSPETPPNRGCTINHVGGLCWTVQMSVCAKHVSMCCTQSCSTLQPLLIMCSLQKDKYQSTLIM
jgi:hypothetical protein